MPFAHKPKHPCGSSHIAARWDSVIRVDGGTAYVGAVVTRFYDPLKKVTAWAPTSDEAIDRMARVLTKSRIRSVATNLAICTI